MTPPLTLIQRKLTRLKDVKKYGMRAKGQREYINYLEGKKTGLRDGVAGHCYDCMGWMADGKLPCPDELCSLHKWSPYSNQKQIVASCSPPKKAPVAKKAGGVGVLHTTRTKNGKFASGKSTGNIKPEFVAVKPVVQKVLVI